MADSINDAEVAIPSDFRSVSSMELMIVIIAGGIMSQSLRISGLFLRGDAGIQGIGPVRSQSLRISGLFLRYYDAAYAAKSDPGRNPFGFQVCFFISSG